MADSLFPTFDFPEIEDDDVVVEKYKPSVYFDFEKGDFALDGANRMIEADGREAFIQWCIKTLSTERDDLLAYGEDYGIEFDELVNLPNREQKENWIEETITGALMENPACESVDDFSFRYEADSLYVSFAVKGYNWNREQLTIPVPTQ